MNSTMVRLIAVPLVAAGLACGRETAQLGPLSPAGPPLASNQTIATNATVRYVGLEGGCWALETAGGTYSPTSLPTQLQ